MIGVKKGGKKAGRGRRIGVGQKNPTPIVDDLQKALYATEIERIETELAKQRHEEGVKKGAAIGGKTAGRGRPLPLGTKNPRGYDEDKKEKARKQEENRAATRAARQVGWSRKKLQKAQKILSNLSDTERQLLVSQSVLVSG